MGQNLRRSTFLGAGRALVQVSGIAFGGSSVPVIAGPNLVEDEILIYSVAEAVKQAGADMLRGGAFKPLTFPYRSAKYRETGRQGVEWLVAAGEQFGLPVVTEVISTAEIDFVASRVDMIQIGSRNMQNFPLLVAAARTGKPILLKRHFGCSLRDFLGAAEYILEQGNTSLVLCERGVSAPHTHRSTSRFLLDLQIVPAVHEISNLPIIVDPSHATFWRPWVAPMALASVAAGADGLMLEVHPDPNNAAVDPLQPLDIQEFQELMPRIRRVASLVR